MKAIVIESFGGPEVLVVKNREAGTPGPGEIRIRIRATAVNRADLLQRMGVYPAPKGAPPDIPGLEYAGEIDAIGEDVSGFREGDRVFGIAGGGTYAEALVVHAKTATAIPDELSWIEAAAIPEATMTAYDAMVEQGRLAAGETVLVSAVGSGVGTAAIQIANAIGARTIGTARSSEKLERAKTLGLHHGVVAKDGQFAKEILATLGGEGPDVVVELVGGSYLAEDIACIAPRGRIVLVGLTGGANAELALGAVLHKRVTIIGTVLRSRSLDEKIAATRSFAAHVVPLVRARKVRPVIDRVFSLEEASEAHAHVASNRGFGKVVLTV